MHTTSVFPRFCCSCITPSRGALYYPLRTEACSLDYMQPYGTMLVAYDDLPRNLDGCTLCHFQFVLRGVHEDFHVAPIQ